VTFTRIQAIPRPATQWTLIETFHRLVVIDVPIIPAPPPDVSAPISAPLDEELHDVYLRRRVGGVEAGRWFG
jgi:hypothetical protein